MVLFGWSGPVAVRVPVLRSPVRSGFFRGRLVRSGPDPLGAGPVRSESHGPLVRCGPVRWSDLGSGPVPSLMHIAITFESTGVYRPTLYICIRARECIVYR